VGRVLGTRPGPGATRSIAPSHYSGDPIIDAKQLAVVAARIADEKKGETIQVIEVGDQLKVAEYFVIVSGSSRAHVKALHNELHVRLKAAGHLHSQPEGAELGWWVVLDYGDVVVHILQPEARDYYDIERLYGDCPRVDVDAEPEVELPQAPSFNQGA